MRHRLIWPLVLLVLLGIQAGCGMQVIRLAVKENVQACKDGKAVGCYNAGISFYSGKGTPKDPKRAIRLFTKACQAGVGPACSNAATMWFKGQGTAASPQHAEEMLKKACFLKEGDACSQLGIRYHKDKARAFRLFTMACMAGSGNGCHNLAELYRRGHGVLRNSTRAFGLFKKLCARHVYQACVNLGVMAMSGDVGPKDPEWAGRLFTRACSKDVMTGCFRLAQMKMKRDFTASLGLFRRACASIPRACFFAASMMEEPRLGKPKPGQAIRYYEQACTGSVSLACYRLGVTSRKGILGRKSPLKGAYYLAKGCHLNHPPSCYLLGQMFESGDGVRTHLGRAKTLYLKACASGVSAACQRFRTLTTQPGSVR